jgi:carbon-monoxide dehydrogenase medium subunit
MAISVVSAAAYLELDGQGRIKAARVALGSVAPCPVRSPHAETVLLDQLADGALFRRAGQGALTDLSPVDDVRATGSYRRLAAAVVTERALSQAWEQAQGRLS